MKGRVIPFTKLSGAGNDFVLIEAARIPQGLSRPALARRLCPRRSSVGADGILVVSKGRAPVLDYYNADGSRAFCGNGSRCAAWWMHLRGWAGRRFSFDSCEGPIAAVISGREKVRIRMPDAYGLRSLRLKATGRAFKVWALNTGVPHAVVAVRKLEDFPVFEAGRALRRHAAFKPAGTNVNFARLERALTRIRTYERGVEDETLACGTGAVAAAILTYARTGRRPPVRVATRGGLLAVRFQPAGGGRFEDVWLEGPARVVYEGEVRL